MKEDRVISWKMLTVIFGVLAFGLLVFVSRNNIVSFFTGINKVDIAKIFVLLVGVATWAYILAQYGIFISFIKSGEIISVELGKSFYKLIPNVPGYGVLDNKIALVSDGAKKPKSFLGIFWIGFYPIQKIHRYEFSWDKIIQKNEVETEQKKSGVIDETNFGIISHRSEEVASVRHQNSYPIILRDMEMKDQIKLDLYFDVIFEMVDPVFSIFRLNGKWLSLATGAFSGLINDFLSVMELRRTTKSKGNKFFEETDKASEFSKIFYEKNSIILEASGVIVSKVVFRDYAISGSEDMKKATTALAIADLNAKAKIAEALGEATKIREIGKANADAIRETKEAEAKGLESKLLAALTHPQGGDIAIEQEKASAVRDFTGSTLVQGGGSVSTMLPLEQGARKKGLKNGKTTDAD